MKSLQALRLALLAGYAAAMLLICVQIFEKTSKIDSIEDSGSFKEVDSSESLDESIWVEKPRRQLLSASERFSGHSLRGPSKGIDKQDLFLNNSFAMNPSHLGTGYFSIVFYPSGDCSGVSSFIEAYATDVCLPVPPDQSGGQWLSMKYTCVSNGKRSTYVS
jgi:hypothetical protein